VGGCRLPLLENRALKRISRIYEYKSEEVIMGMQRTEQ
jgi:hypothetical protein